MVDFDRVCSEARMQHNWQTVDGNVENYLRWSLSLFHIQKNKRILDLGCGPCIYFHGIMEYEPALYCATDYSDNFLNAANKLFEGRGNCTMARLDLMDRNAPAALSGNNFDYILCFDVLEHLENDREALLNIKRIINNTGRGTLLLRVPALQAIYGENDRAIGHYRRYSMKSLTGLLNECSFTIELIRYQNIIGIIPWYIIGNVLKRSMAVSSNEGRVFNRMVPIVSFIEKLCSPPVGLSLYCLCTVKN